MTIKSISREIFSLALSTHLSSLRGGSDPRKAVVVERSESRSVLPFDGFGPHADPEHITGSRGVETERTGVLNQDGTGRNCVRPSSNGENLNRAVKLMLLAAVLTHNYVVTKHERVAQACSRSRCSVQSPRISDQANAQSRDKTRRSRTNAACQRATETKSDRGRRGESTLCSRSRAAVTLRLPNEALLIQIRVNDYLIIPILQRAPAPSVLCPVNLQCANPESATCHETLARPDRSG